MDNLAIIKQTYEGNNAQENAQNLVASLAEKVRWTEAAGFPYAGTYTGADEIIQQVFQRLENEWQDFRFQVEDYVASDNQVVAYGHYSGRYKQTGHAFSARVAHLWKLENGKIVSFEQFVDSHMVRQAMQ